ncbi:hypothetical protein ACED16_02635 [Enterobacter hormaechei]
MRYQADKAIIKKLKVLKDRIQEEVNNNDNVYIAHSQGIYSIVIESTEGDEIKEAYYHHLGKLKSTSVNKKFIDRQFIRISNKTL